MPENSTPNANITALMKSSNESYQQINDAIEDFAIIIAKSLEDKEFREFIKAEACNKFDGDYDILYSLVKDKATKSGKTLASRVSEITSDFKKSSKFKTSFGSVEELINKIPKLQIAVPVNCEKWNTDNFIPPVACLNSELKKKEVTQIKAYDSKGSVVMLDKKNRPDYPVVVISINERLDEKGKVRDCYLAKNTTSQNTVYNPKITAKVSGWGTVRNVLNDTGEVIPEPPYSIHSYLVIDKLMKINNSCWDAGWSEGGPEFYLDVWQKHSGDDYHNYLGRQYFPDPNSEMEVGTLISCTRDLDGLFMVHLAEEDGGNLGGDDFVENEWKMNDVHPAHNSFAYNISGQWYVGMSQPTNANIQIGPALRNF